MHRASPRAAALAPSTASFEQNAFFHLIVQQTPRMRAALCELGTCDTRGVPVKLPSQNL